MYRSWIQAGLQISREREYGGGTQPKGPIVLVSPRQRQPQMVLCQDGGACSRIKERQVQEGDQIQRADYFLIVAGRFYVRTKA